MKKILLLLLFTTCSMISYTQQLGGGDPSDKLREPNNEIIEAVKVSCVYEQVVINFVDEQGNVKKDEHRMLLQIGNNISKYFDEKYYVFDSIHTALRKQNVNFTDGMNQLMPILRRLNSEQLFKKYPKDRITTQTSLLGTYIYEEDIPIIKWTFVNGSKDILGYECKKATCNLFGREYEVWYTPQLARSDGPWKLGGLPGLILEATDATGKVSFICVSLRFPKKDIEIFIQKEGRNTIRTDKKSFRKMEEKYLENPRGAIDATGLVTGLNGSDKVSKKRIKTFIELD